MSVLILLLYKLIYFRILGPRKLASGSGSLLQASASISLFPLVVGEVLSVAGVLGAVVLYQRRGYGSAPHCFLNLYVPSSREERPKSKVV